MVIWLGRQAEIVLQEDSYQPPTIASGRFLWLKIRRSGLTVRKQNRISQKKYCNPGFSGLLLALWLVSG